MESKSKLRTYRKVKSELETEKYLEEGTAQERRVMVMIRGGTNDLRIETGRYEKWEKEERVCIFGESGEVEDEKHFLCRCEAWKDERELVLKEVRKLKVRMSELEEDIMPLSGKEEMKGRGQVTVKRWRNIVLRGGRSRKGQEWEWGEGVEVAVSTVVVVWPRHAVTPPLCRLLRLPLLTHGR